MLLERVSVHLRAVAIGLRVRDVVDVVRRGHDGDGAVIWVDEVGGDSGEGALGAEEVQIDFVGFGVRWPANGKSRVIDGGRCRFGYFA